jgi:ring-1,2-phenylacetyl-CoA epoxidase subunit PaaE
MRFHDLTVSRVTPEAAGAVSITLAVPAALRETFAFQPGQFLTVRSGINGTDVRRSYSISSARSRLAQGELELGIRPVEGGVFSNWAATQLSAGDILRVMPPDGRFTVQKQRAIHRVGFAAGSGITPILSILATTLEEQPESKFTLVYGNRRMDSVMYNEALQDLKDRYPSRLTLIHILSRQTEKTLLEAGVKADRIRTERFTSPTLEALPAEQKARAVLGHKATRDSGEVQLTVVLDGKPYEMPMNRDEKILDIALALGLDLPYSCKGGVCCTCRCKVMQGSTVMDKNFTLEKPEVDAGFVLSCQARPTSARVMVSFDER